MGGFVGGLFGGGQSQPTQANTQIYQPTGTGTSDTNLQSLLGQAYSNVAGASNPYSQLSPQMLQAFTALYSPGTATGYTNAANTAGAGYSSVGTGGVNNANSLQSYLPQLTGAGSQILQTGFDPQSALYNQQLQQTNDQANVTNAQYGLTGQQAAGNTQQADTNFNIDWQNNELSRQIAALSGAGTAGTAAGSAGVAAQAAGGTGASNILAGGATPYTTGQTIGGNQETAITQYLSQLLGPSTSTSGVAGELQNYLNTGINASEGSASQALQDYYGQMQSESNVGSAIGGVLGMQTSPTTTTNGVTTGGSNVLQSLLSGIGAIGSFF